MTRRIYAALSLGVLMAGLTALVPLSPAVAQAARSAVKNAPLKATETKVYGDWTLRCFDVESPAPCDIFLLLSKKDTKQRVMSMSIAYAPSKKRNVLQIIVPLGVVLAKGLTVSADKYKSPALGFRRCSQDGCFVETVVPDSMLDSLQASKGPAKMQVSAITGKDIGFPLSLNGFGQARAALMRESSERAKTSPAPSAPDNTANTPEQ